MIIKEDTDKVFKVEIELEGISKAEVLFKITPPYAAIHVNMESMSLSLLKQMKKDFIVLTEHLKTRGCTHVVGVHPTYSDMRWIKFTALFGFSKPTLTTYLEI